MPAVADIYLHHGAISVRNLERSLDFYQRVLGFEPDTHVSVPAKGMEIVHMKRGDDYIELFCLEGAEELPEHARDHELDFRTIGTKHIAFGTSDAEATHKSLAAHRVEGLTPVYEAEFYKYFFFKDPDGIILEVVYRKS